ncbi:leucyl aminopeptidase family protein [Kitasatospora sp. NPDC059146]|uniref:leucyl aminopeptidase family protein n=1 Tax=Kitasatospora sp. NPDC059146 TaxID=3346741 RepID=UPI0036B6D655
MTQSRTAFDLIPSWNSAPGVEVVTAPDASAMLAAQAVGLPVAQGAVAVPPWLELDAGAVEAAGMTGSTGQVLLLPRAEGADVVLYGTGPAAKATADVLRDAAAAVALAVPGRTRLGIVLPTGVGAAPGEAAQAVVEGVLLARYGFDPLKREPSGTALEAVTVVADPGGREAAQRGAERGLWLARATMLARDLASAPPSLLNAEAMADVAVRLGEGCGLRVEVFGQKALEDLGCGGLLGVNRGGVDEARMIKLTYAPSGAGGDVPRLALVGKGIMYDSGGISLKPADAVHATMKNDMSGAGAILAAMCVLAGLGCRTAVTGYLMCTDNMPSGSALKLGDVLWMRGGTSVEVVNADAEGRLVMADALVLAGEEPGDAVVDIATLTGACLRALGAEIAGVFGNTQTLVDQVLDAAARSGEPAWQLPLSRRYRPELDSEVADLKNMGGPNGGAIHAALFLAEFVTDRPWAHIDIAGPAQNDTPNGWRTKGCTGFGARMLAELALAFTPTSAASPSGSARSISEEAAR